MKCLCCGQDGHALADCQNRGFYFDRKVAAREKARKEGEWAARQAARTKKQEEWDALQETRSNSTVSTADTASSHHVEVHRLVDGDKEVMKVAKKLREIKQLADRKEHGGTLDQLADRKEHGG